MNDQQRAAMQMALEALEFVYINSRLDIRDKVDPAITALREALAQPQSVRQYYYAMIDCKAKSSTDPDCICWHDEGSDSLIGVMEYAKTWREKPLKAQPQGEPVAWAKFTEDCVAVSDDPFEDAIPLYTTPPSVEAAIEATKEKAALVCEEFEQSDFVKHVSEIQKNIQYAAGYESACNHCAAAIRSMK